MNVIECAANLAEPALYMNFQDGALFNELGDPPFGANYASPVPSMLSAPYIDRAAHNIEVPKFPFTFPPQNVSVSNPDPNIDWAAEAPLGSGNPGVWIHDTVPYLERYFLGIQRQLGGATVFTLDYVGSEGRHLADGVESDPGNAALCLSLTGSSLASGQTACGPNLETQKYKLANGATQYGTLALNVQDSCICFASNAAACVAGRREISCL